VSDAVCQFVAPAPRGLADLVAAELKQQGAAEVREYTTSVAFRGPLECGYSACLWSRTASRVLLQLAEFKAGTTEAFYQGVRSIDWPAHIDPAGTIACEFDGRHPSIEHSHFGAQKLKDGICDRLREASGQRPSVKPQRPDVRIIAYASGAQVKIMLDLAGEGLHRRGYRLEAGEAPLRENLAAGILLRVGWPEQAASGAPFLDPLCGSATLVIEAAMIAADLAPGAQREYWGFTGWRGHDRALWDDLLAKARARARAAVPNLIQGTDADAAVLRQAARNATRAGVDALVQLVQRRLSEARPTGTAPGLVCTNPPYGERLGDAAGAEQIHQELGAVLREHFAGWKAAILSAAPEAARALALRTYRTHELWNGAIKCRLLRVDLARPGVAQRAAAGLRVGDAELAQSAGARMFANRLAKNRKRLAALARREQTSCFRLYDADMPEYAFAIDQYVEASTDAVHLQVQEYQAPADIDPVAVARRRAEAFAVLPEVTGAAPERIHIRTRRRQGRAGQYQRLAGEREFVTVAEGAHKFRVNFNDYLDTGLFLDHRLVRRRLGEAAAGKRFLNLFCYTASATVYAAAGGAARTVSVDLSGTYLDWARQNLRLNGLDDARHELISADCRAWLPEAAARGLRFDLIFLDPPTFSNSKRMEGVLDIQRDHEALIEHCMALLASGGLLVFSTNAQRFRLAGELAARWDVKDISAATIAFDFKRNARIHRCFEIRAR